MGYGGSVGLELGWPGLASRSACGSCLAHGWLRLVLSYEYLWSTAEVFDWCLVGPKLVLLRLPTPALAPASAPALASALAPAPASAPEVGELALPPCRGPTT